MYVLKRRLLVVLALITAMAVGGATVVLATADSGDVIHACVHDGTGEIRIVDSDARCRRGFSPLSWNREGPPGVDGISGYEVVGDFWAGIEVQPGDLLSYQTWCPDDKSVISGGYAYANFDLGALIVEDSFPITQEGPHKWRVQWRNISDTAVVDDFQVWAICADV